MNQFDTTNPIVFINEMIGLTIADIADAMGVSAPNAHNLKRTGRLSPKNLSRLRVLIDDIFDRLDDTPLQQALADRLNEIWSAQKQIQHDGWSDRQAERYPIKVTTHSKRPDPDMVKRKLHLSFVHKRRFDKREWRFKTLEDANTFIRSFTGKISSGS